MVDELGAPIPFGIRSDTGLPLNGLSNDAIAAMLERERRPTADTTALSRRNDTSDLSFAVEGGIDAGDLGQAGWGVIFSPSVTSETKEALKPLLDHRKAQAAPFKIFDGPDGYLKGDGATDWLKRRNVRMDVVNPEYGVPFYLLLVGPPDEFPFEFQYSLDIYWAVGRLWFDTPEQFRRYADSVVRYKSSPTVPTSSSGSHVCDRARF